MLLVASAVLLVLAVLVDIGPWRWVSWGIAAEIIGEHRSLAIIGLPAAALLAASLVRLIRTRNAAAPTNGASKIQWPWLLSDQGIGAIAGTVATVGVIALAVMLVVAESASGVERAKLQIEAIKYGIGAVAAGGAAAALLLAVRRQRFSEHAHEHTVSDAAERRVTELYTKAVEQLGSNDAAVRLGGLYALERLAQDNPHQRQTIVNVLCAYLRMPYLPPPVPAAHSPSADKPRLTELPLLTNKETPDTTRDARQELQVRLTAQRILTRHLSVPPGLEPQHATTLAQDSHQPFWLGIDIDLTGATLVDWNLQRGHVRVATFTQATFAGDAKFEEASFTGDARFLNTSFNGDAEFRNASFTGLAQFDNASFSGGGWFDDAVFAGEAWFSNATFGEFAGFNRATFGEFAWFDEATIDGIALFDKATFGSVAAFHMTTFALEARFVEATFKDDAAFGEASFNGSARFERASVVGDARFDDTSFNGDAWFSETVFFGDVPDFSGAHAVLRDRREDCWPPGWHLKPASERPGMSRLVRDEPATDSGRGLDESQGPGDTS
ncbi:pentapeptide repeat-containing protein [Micromonospora phytophila]|uniref:pentapeptide repeat-containing protein n=1 Tax=Micromonospora phytophila TaxID=709888 RepID=UPI0020309AC8|nr:pentapeptide repeat-containing protein [Micromonospora phytophila]MCM0673603.1 pentapeptide repeat-containing protein [Micromonospora phytophila]